MNSDTPINEKYTFKKKKYKNKFSLFSQALSVHCYIYEIQNPYENYFPQE